MADKTTTLKTKTNDNVYPNVIGDNRKNAFVDSSTITHHFYDKTHKVGFQINNDTNIKIQNSLQKPAGLTKTELVGVGTNGQENIEIGDNLTLANGKLSATGGGGGSNINILTGSEPKENNEGFVGTYSGVPDKSKINVLHIDNFGDFVITFLEDGFYSGYVDSGGAKFVISLLEGEYTLKPESEYTINIITIGDGDHTFNGTLVSSGLTLFSFKVPDQSFYVTIPVSSYGIWGAGTSFGFDNDSVDVYVFYEASKKYEVIKYHLKYYSHFITITNSTDNVALYLTIQNTIRTELIANDLVSYLNNKKVLVNGNLHGVVPTYITGEGGVIKVHYMTPGDSNINPTPDEYQDFSSFTITDLVTPVE